MTFSSLIGKAFAQQVLKERSSDICCFKALYYLFCTTFQGHQCVTLEKDILTPDPFFVLEPSERESFSLKELIEGFHLLPQSVFQESCPLNLKPVVKENSEYYLQKYYFFEQSLIASLKKVNESSPSYLFTEEEIKGQLSARHLLLNKEQQEAIAATLLSSIHILTGGPGTGKSYTVKHLLDVYLALCLKQDKKPRILIAAPTGKVVAFLKEKLEREEKFIEAHITVATLHSALKIKKEREIQLFPYDLVIVDEASMVDLSIWDCFFKSLKEGARVLLIGDQDQLPPIESGMVFEQLACSFNSTHLKVCMRTESSLLLQLAENIRNQQREEIKNLLEKTTSLELRYIECEKESNLLDIKEKNLLEFYLEESLDTRVILTPLHQGVWGTEAINQLLYEKIALKKQEVPILVTKTNYDLNIFNGDIGILSKDKVIFLTQGKQREIPLPLISHYEYAYAISIHKSQGSEYDHVVLFLPEGSDRFGQQIFYTAVTRAKKSLTIFACKETLQRCLLADGKKHSVLKKKLAVCCKQII